MTFSIMAADGESWGVAVPAADLASWIGTENYEMRVAADGSWIDEKVLAILRSARAAR